MSDDSAPLTNLGDPSVLDTFITRVIRVPEPAQRRAQIERFLRTVDEAVAAVHLDQVLRRCSLGSAECLEVTLSLAELLGLLRPNTDLRVESLNLIARQEDRTALAWFLLEPPPQRVPPERNAYARAEQSPLGIRRAEAAGWQRDRLERLLHDDEPMVVERLCANPRILRQHMLTLVTRRPTRSQALQMVARFPRWFRDSEIRFAMASNPYNDTGLSLRILPTLNEHLLQRLVLAQDLHPALRHACAFWLGLREDPARISPEPRILDPLHS